MEGDRVSPSVDGGRNKQAVTRARSLSLFRPSSLIQHFRNSGRFGVLNSYPSTDTVNTADAPVSKNVVQNIKDSFKKGWDTIVTVVIVEAKDLPDPPSDGTQHSLYCKIKLGNETQKSKTAPSSHQPEFRERFNLPLKDDQLLRVSVWDKGKQKNFMGSCVIDLKNLEKERSHELWQTLEDGFGSIHLNITMCAIRQTEAAADNGPTVDEVKEKFDLCDLNDWSIVGQLHVKVIGARGLNGKPSAYCTLELANARVQTPSARASPEPSWNKVYVFNVYDVSNTLDLKVYDSILVSSLGKVSIPLLWIRNGETRWYALKDKSKRNIAKGNCPRVLLEITLIWNPIKGSLRLFQPMEVKYIRKPPKFDLALVHSNLIFIRDTFNALEAFNDIIKSSFEWENREICTIAIVGWLIFWYCFQPWAMPLLLLLPFVYYWFDWKSQFDIHYRRYNNNNIFIENSQIDNEKPTSVTGKIQELPEVTLVITRGVEYIASVAERLYNLITFKVPFLSYLSMLLLVISSVVLYNIPFNYLMMLFGLYKYTRKLLNPGRILNNDLLDFISRVPDNDILKQWEQPRVPEPIQRQDLAALDPFTYLYFKIAYFLAPKVFEQK